MNRILNCVLVFWFFVVFFVCCCFTSLCFWTALLSFFIVTAFVSICDHSTQNTAVFYRNIYENTDKLLLPLPRSSPPVNAQIPRICDLFFSTLWSHRVPNGVAPQRRLGVPLCALATRLSGVQRDVSESFPPTHGWTGQCSTKRFSESSSPLACPGKTAWRGKKQSQCFQIHTHQTAAASLSCTPVLRTFLVFPFFLSSSFCSISGNADFWFHTLTAVPPDL